jgi:hypothetical protein
MKIEVSNGEIVDKLSILSIKMNKITNSDKNKNVRVEFNMLCSAFAKLIRKYGVQLNSMYSELKDINEKLWGVESDLRELEKGNDFGERFVFLARNVYIYNDIRAELKRKVNTFTDSLIVEEKSYY